MEVQGKVVAITGGANGIGRALAERFAAEGARHVAVADLDGDGARAAAAVFGGSGWKTDVSREAEIVALIDELERAHGQVDLFCSNAGVIDVDPDLRDAASAPDALWERGWKVNVMSHVWAARRLLPAMLARREGWFLNTVSAAGLLMQVGSAVYTTTKHAALGFAESLAVTHRDDGVGVTVLCPQAVDTAMARAGNFAGADVDGVLTVEDVAEAAVRGLEEGRFMVLPHASVAGYAKAKAENHDRWVGGMAKFRRMALPQLARSALGGG